MKRIENDKCLCIYNEAELERVYETDGTIEDIVKILEDYDYYKDYTKEDWECGVGIERVHCNKQCHSLEDIAITIIEDFYFEDGNLYIGIDGYTPNS